MRTYGRIVQPNGSLLWVEVLPDANGDFSYGWITTLIQCLKLSLGESPVYGNYGIPAQKSVITQIFPDFYVTQTQQQFAPYFASLTVQKLQSTTPSYNIRAVLNNGTIVQATIAI